MPIIGTKRKRGYMKQVMFAGSAIAILILGFLIVMTLEHGTIRMNEMDDTLKPSVEAAIEELETSGMYSIDNEDAFVAAFNELLLNDINAGSKDKDGNLREDKNFKLKIEIMGVDYEKGLLSLRVTENYTHPNGKVGEFKCETTAVLNKTAALDTYTVKFIDKDETVMEMNVEKNDVFPGVPSNKNEGFKYWKNVNENKAAIFPETVNEDLTYVAVY